MIRAKLPIGEPVALLDAVAQAGFARWGGSQQGRGIFGTRWVGQASHASEPPARRHLLVVGAVHGDEPASAEAVLDLATRLEPGRLLAGAAVSLLPMLNPDGLVAGRKNSARDVDLNRNFPARNFTREHSPGYHPGPAPLSEPETALLADMVDRQAVDAVVAVHAPFACVNFDGPAAAWADAVAAACGWPARPSIGYPTPGSLGSWLGVDRGLPVLTLELPPGPYASFRAPASAALDAALAYLKILC